MRRWHSERNLMLRRWRLEIALHEARHGQAGYRTYNSFDFAPIPPVMCDDSCHCYLGCGFFRKRHPLDCGNTKCGTCHSEKFYSSKARHNNRLAAIKYELKAEGYD